MPTEDKESNAGAQAAPVERIKPSERQAATFASRKPPLSMADAQCGRHRAGHCDPSNFDFAGRAMPPWYAHRATLSYARATRLPKVIEFTVAAFRGVSMQYTRLGSSSLVISRIGLGMMNFGSSERWDAIDPGHGWMLDEAQTLPIVRKAFDLGINFIETSDAYSFGACEEITGAVLRDLGKANRQQVVVAGKMGDDLAPYPNSGGYSRKHIMSAIDGTLTKLGTDYVDLYQIHNFPHDNNVEEMLVALHDVVKSGKARYIGAGTMAAWQLGKLLSTSEKLGLTKFVSIHNHYNVLYREDERELLPLCRSEGIGVIPWSPLARGLLGGNRNAAGETFTQRAKVDVRGPRMYGREDDFAMAAEVAKIAKARGVSSAQVAIAWLLAQPGVHAPVFSPSSVAHVEDVVKSIEIKLTEGELKSLADLYRPHPVLGHR